MTKKKILASVATEIPLKPEKPVEKPRSKPKEALPVPIIPTVPIGSYLVGKVFAYEGKIWKKVNIMPDGANRCLRCEVRDGGLYPMPGTSIDLTPDTEVPI